MGYSFVYNTLDNNRNPTKGVLAELRQDFAGVGGDVNFIRTTGDVRWYYELISDIVSVLHLQGGYVTGWGDKDLRMLDHFQMGPNLVRGFATAGIGPRDLTFGTSNDALGGTMYWGTSVETQFPIFGVPKDFGLRLAIFADADMATPPDQLRWDPLPMPDAGGCWHARCTPGMGCSAIRCTCTPRSASSTTRG